MKEEIKKQLQSIAKQLLDEDVSVQVSHLKVEVSKLYDKLVQLEYLESLIQGAATPKMEESLDSKSFRERNWFVEPKPVPQSPHQEDLAEPAIEKIKDIVAHIPEETEETEGIMQDGDFSEDKIHSSPFESKETKEIPSEKEDLQKKTKQSPNDLEIFAEHYQHMPEFERKNNVTPPKSETDNLQKKQTITGSEFPRKKSLNEALSRGLNIGLNDRLAFVKHLFEGQTEDYTRVLSQLETFDTFEEAADFINENVKPDYNHWESKEEYVNRFMMFVQKQFD